MALPESQAFEDFLADARVVAEQPASGPRELVQQSAGSPLGPGSELWLAYPSGALQLNSVLKKVEEGLAEVGAPSSRSVALAVLVLIVGTKGTTRHVEHANRLLREVRQAELSFNFVSPTQGLVKVGVTVRDRSSWWHWVGFAAGRPGVPEVGDCARALSGAGAGLPATRSSRGRMCLIWGHGPC